MRWSRLGWWTMAVLALLVAGYAFVVSLVPGWRPPLVRDLFALRPLAAWGHFLGGATALAAGALQLHSRLRNRWLGLHRWLGRLYVMAVATGGLAALMLAPHAATGAVAVTGFTLLGLAWPGWQPPRWRCAPSASGAWRRAATGWCAAMR